MRQVTLWKVKMTPSYLEDDVDEASYLVEDVDDAIYLEEDVDDAILP